MYSDSLSIERAQSTSNLQSGDFGVAVQLKKSWGLTEPEKYFLLTKHFVPSCTYVPSKTYSNRQWSFQRSWLQKYNGLVYSEQDCGCYCKFCVLFADYRDARITTYGALVTNWKATRKLSDHFGKAKYHAEAVELASNFTDTMSGHTQPITHQLQSARVRQVRENREKLFSIVDTIITCGKQGIPLRGHRDDRKHDKSNPYANHDNFLELLKFRACGGDEVLERQLRTSSRNSRYTSKTIQNELITICGDMIRNRILDDIRQAKFYSVIADEASDSANDEQLAISIRYVDTSGNAQEWFLGFSECNSGVTGNAIAENSTSNLGSWQLELTNMCGQAYDGAGAMSGATKGVPHAYWKSAQRHNLRTVQLIGLIYVWSSAALSVKSATQWTVQMVLSGFSTILPSVSCSLKRVCKMNDTPILNLSKGPNWKSCVAHGWNVMMPLKCLSTCTNLWSFALRRLLCHQQQNGTGKHAKMPTHCYILCFAFHC